MADFSMNHGDVNSGVSDERPATMGGVPKTGFADSPMTEDGCCNFESAPGCGANKARVH